MAARTFKDLVVYQKAFSVAMDIFNITKGFPREEKFSLIDQIRRNSRSVAVCIAEAYRKRNYPAYFVSKCSDADMENSETQVWLEFAHACSYLDQNTKTKLENVNLEIGRMLNHMIEFPEKYRRKGTTNS